MTFVDTERAVCQKDNYSVKRYRMSHRLNILGARRWIQSAFMLLTYSLNERAVITAFAYRKTNFMLSEIFKTIESTLNLLNFGIDCQIIPKYCVNCICRYSRTFSQENSKLI